MAYSTKYRIYFSDIDNDEYYADIQYDAYSGSIIELDPTGNPCIIEWGRSEDKFNTVNASGCKLSFYNNDYDLSDLFVTDPTEARVLVWRKEGSNWFLVYSGYLNPEVYEEDYSWTRGEVEVTSNDGLNASGRVKYFSGSNIDSDTGLVINPKGLGFKTTNFVIANCLVDLVFERIYTVIDVTGENTDFYNMLVDLSNYVDEDNESMTRREVLETILKPFNLKIYHFGRAVWIVDVGLIADNPGVVPFKAYNNLFNPVVTEDGNVDLVKDISDFNNDEAKFIGGNQKIRMTGGFKRIISNYSAYPDKSKVIPTNLDDIILDPDYNTDWVDFEYEYKDGGFLYRDKNVLGYDYSEYGFELGSLASITEYVSRSTDGEFNQAKLDEAAGKLSGERCLLIAASLNSSSVTTDPDEDTIVYTGGRIVKSDDILNISFKVLADYSAIKDRGWIKMEIPVKVKVGTKYGVLNNGTFDTWGTSNVGYHIAYNGSQFAGSWVDFSFTVRNIPESGVFKLIFGRDTKVYDSDGQTALPIPVDNQKFRLFINDFDLGTNDLSVSEDDVEYKVESDVDFLKSTSIEINNSSRRENGTIDRGGFINANYEHETNFKISSYPQLGSIGLTIGQAYLSNYSDPFRTLDANISHAEFLRKTRGETVFSSTPGSIDNVFTPISIVMDTDYLGTDKFCFMGGSLNLTEKIIKGRWDQVKNSNFTIT